MNHIDKNSIPDELYQLPVAIYGGGYTGRRIIDLLIKKEIKVKYIIDDDEGVQGTYIENIEVISFQQFIELSRNYKNNAVILTTIYGKAVLKKLNLLTNISVYELYDCVMEEIGLSDTVKNMTKESNKVENLKIQLRMLENEMADEESRCVIEGIIHYFDTKNLNYLADICTEDEHYMISEVRNAIRDPLYIIDAGAYKGELQQTLKSSNIEFKKWYCFEADKVNFTNLLERSKCSGLKDGQQICINKGLWSKSGKLYFEGGKEGTSKIVPYETKDVIDVVSIDDYLKNVNCNYIKMDIEGAELPALRGGVKLIKRERPILAISIYHSLNDYWEIPRFLMNELNNYKYYVRHHSLVSSETVLYGIPCEL